VPGVDSLCRILEADRDPRSVVAWRWDSELGCHRSATWGEFQQHLGRLCALLRREPTGAWLVAVDDAYACAVALLALWGTGRCAVLPPNLQPGTLAHLETRTAGALCDLSGRLSPTVSIDPLAAPEGFVRLDPLDPDAVALELFTSGSTGDEKVVTKRIRHLEDEIGLLEKTWGSLAGRSTVLATASHNYLYGLLFGVLWPLIAGRPFHAQRLVRASELLPRVRELGDCVLASVPAHLRRLAQHRGLGALRGSCRAIFSSGGPLPADTAQRLALKLGQAPIEVFGSTETGGVAWRIQEAGMEQPAWRPLDGVQVSLDADSDVARVRSPFVSVGDPDEGFALGDRIQMLPDGRFLLHGRIDRIVKVGEKRLDLSLMESDLRAHPLVSDAALLVLEQTGDARVAAAIVPTPAGERLLRKGGRRAVSRALGDHLADRWDGVLLPRSWRVVPALPENPRGKVSVESLRALFETPADGSRAGQPVDDRPEVLASQRSACTVEWTCRVPDLSCWPGHFPDFPIVPGVLQIDWAMDAVAELLGEPPRVQEMSSVTFRDMLRPRDAFRIRVEAERGGWVRFRLWGAGTEHAAGRVRLATDPETGS